MTDLQLFAPLEAATEAREQEPYLKAVIVYKPNSFAEVVAIELSKRLVADAVR